MIAAGVIDSFVSPKVPPICSDPLLLPAWTRRVPDDRQWLSPTQTVWTQNMFKKNELAAREREREMYIFLIYIYTHLQWSYAYYCTPPNPPNDLGCRRRYKGPFAIWGSPTFGSAKSLNVIISIHYPFWPANTSVTFVVAPQNLQNHPNLCSPKVLTHIDIHRHRTRSSKLAKGRSMISMWHGICQQLEMISICSHLGRPNELVSTIFFGDQAIWFVDQTWGTENHPKFVNFTYHCSTMFSRPWTCGWIVNHVRKPRSFRYFSCLQLVCNEAN